MSLSQLEDDEIWRGMAEASEAMFGLARLYSVLPPENSPFALTEDARRQLLSHLATLDKLRTRFDDYFAELERRYFDDPSDDDADQDTNQDDAEEETDAEDEQRLDSVSHRPVPVEAISKPVEKKPMGFFRSLLNFKNMNDDPEQQQLAILFVAAAEDSNGQTELTNWIIRQPWSASETRTRIVHALSLVRVVAPPDTYARAKEIGETLHNASYRLG